jgi:toxin ParE1/3/4
MTYRVELSERAVADVRDAYDYIDEHGPADPDQWKVGLDKVLTSLETFPEACGLAHENRGARETIRQAFYGRYRVLFTIRDSVVHIITIRHGARQFIRPDDLESI